MKYLDKLTEFIENDSLQTRAFTFDTRQQALNCYGSVQHYLQKHNLSYTLYLSAKQNTVVVSKQALQKEETILEIHDNIDIHPFAEQKTRYGAKYVSVFSDFLNNPELHTRELTLPTETKTQSCYQSMKRLIKKFNSEDTIQVFADRHKKTVHLQKAE